MGDPRPAEDPRAAELRFSAALDAALETIGIFTPLFDERGGFVDAEIVFINRVALERWFDGVALDAIRGRRLFAEFPTMRTRLLDLYRAVAETGTPFHGPRSFLRLDGTTLWTELSVSAFPGGLVHTSRNITAEREAREALARSEALYRRAVTAMHDGIVVQGPDGVVTAANPRACEILGLSVDEVTRRTNFDPQWAATREDGRPFPGAEHPAMVTLRTGEPCRGVLMGLAHPDGRRRWISINTDPLPDPAGGPRSVVAAFADVTDARAAEQALVQARAELLEAQRLAHVGSWTIDAATGAMVWSDEMARITGHEPGAPVPSFDAGAGAHDAAALAQRNALYTRTLETGEPWELEYDLRRPDGSVRRVLGRGEAVRDASGAITGVRGTLTDVTEARAAELAMREQAHLIDLAHDALIVRDLESRVVFWSAGAEKTYGWSAAEALGRVTHDLLRTEFPAPPAELDAELAASGSWIGELIHTTKSGRRISVDSRQSLDRRPDGTVAAVLEVNRDVTVERAGRLALAASERLYRGLVEMLDEAVVVHGPDASIVTTNRRARELLGFVTDAPTGRIVVDPGWEVRDVDGVPVPPERHGVLITLRTGRSIHNEPLVLVHADGRQIAISASVEPLADQDGNVAAAMVVFRDVTREREIEASTASILESIAEGVIIAGRDGGMVSMSSRAEEIFGWPASAYGTIDMRAALWGLTWADGSPVADDELPLRATLRTGLPVQPRECTFCWPDGQRRWVTIGCDPLRDPSGELAGAVLSLTDVTETRALEQALRLDAAGHRTLIDDAGDGMVRVTDDGTVLEANAAFHAMLGVAEGTLVGSSVRAYLAPEDPHPPQAPGPEPGRSRVGHRTFARPDGSRVTVAWSATRLADGSSLATVRDLAVQQDLEEQVQRSRRLETLGQLTGGVAHDFNNLLTAIAGSAEFLADAVPADDPRRKDVDTILDAGDRATRLTRQLLTLGRVADPEDTAPTDLDAAVADVAPLLRRTLGAAFDIHLDLAAGPGPVALPRGSIDQVVVNLAANARDAMPGGGRVTIATARLELTPARLAAHPSAAGGDYVRLSVSDTGTGIRPDVLPRIFDAYYTTKVPGRGTGLGLATVARIVREAAGWIEVESALDHGATFHVALPRAAVAAAGLGPADDGLDSVRGSETVLVVEDDEAALDIAARQLRSLGYVVLAHGDPRRAVELAGEPASRVDLLATDLAMPGLDGLALVDALRTRWPRLPVVLFSGSDPGEAVAGRVAESGMRFVRKPFDRRAFGEAVRAALDDAARPPDATGDD